MSSVMKSSEGLSSRVSNIIRKYIGHTKLYDSFVYHIFSCAFGSTFYHCTYGCMVCMLLFNFVNYVFLLLRLCRLFVMFIYYYCYV